MLHSGANGARPKVNVLKKVKVDGKWQLCPVVVEPSGKLKDRVQVNGRAELHNEGVYHIEWREDRQRLRQSVPNRNHVPRACPSQSFVIGCQSWDSERRETYFILASFDRGGRKLRQRFPRHRDEPDQQSGWGTT